MLRVSELQREAETPGERVISVCCAMSVTQWCRVSSKRTPALPQHPPPYHRHQPPLLTAHRGATPITCLMTEASPSLLFMNQSPAHRPLPPCSPCCLVTGEPELVNKNQIDSAADCWWVLAGCDPARFYGWQQNGMGHKQTDTSKQRQPPAFLTSARYFTLTHGC